MAAQNQHYVPKFILRQFLRDQKKEQVRVYDKHRDVEFTTSIRNIMAERRFNEFGFEDFIVSFEPAAGKIEDTVLPAYQSVLKYGKLDGSPEQQAALAFLIAFQFVRTKAHRDRWKQLDDAVRQKIEVMGGKIEDLEGYVELTENEEKRQHLLNVVEFVQDFAPLIAAKNFCLMEAPKGRSFYLGDNPVVMHNDEDFGFYGNIGLAVHGIQIYMPLSSKFTLCALCPTIAQKMRHDLQEGRKERQAEIVNAMMSGKITVADSIRIRKSIQDLDTNMEQIVQQFETGGTFLGREGQVDFINSMQAMHASRFVVCKRADLNLAKKHNQEFPKYRNGPLLSFS